MLPRETWEANDSHAVMRMFTADASMFPYRTLMGIGYSAIERGCIESTFAANEWFCAYSRSVAPGVIASLGYAAGFSAEYTLLELGESLVALDDQVIHFYRPIPCDGRQLRAEASASRQEQDRVVAVVPMLGDIPCGLASRVGTGFRHGGCPTRGCSGPPLDGMKRGVMLRDRAAAAEPPIR